MKLEIIISPNGKQWKLTDVKTRKILDIYNTQKEAIDIAKAKLKNNINGGELSVQGRNGKIRIKNSYGKNNDPRKIKG